MSTVPARPRLGPAYSPTVRDLRRSGPVRSAAVGLVLATALLSGCAEKQEARDTLPTPSAAPTTEQLTELGPPNMPMPEEARKQTAAGAEAFTRYYVEIYNHAMRTLDTTYMRELSQACDTCDQLADQVDGVAAAGQKYEGGHARVVASTPPYLTGDEAQLEGLGRRSRHG